MNKSVMKKPECWFNAYLVDSRAVSDSHVTDLNEGASRRNCLVVDHRAGEAKGAGEVVINFCRDCCGLRDC